MSTPPVIITEISSLIGSIAVLAAGVRILLATWDAPMAGALPSVITERDRQRYDEHLNVRQVLMAFFGVILVVWAAWHLLD